MWPVSLQVTAGGKCIALVRCGQWVRPGPGAVLTSCALNPETKEDLVWITGEGRGHWEQEGQSRRCGNGWAWGEEAGRAEQSQTETGIKFVFQCLTLILVKLHVIHVRTSKYFTDLLQKNNNYRRWAASFTDYILSANTQDLIFFQTSILNCVHCSLRAVSRRCIFLLKHESFSVL